MFKKLFGKKNDKPRMKDLSIAVNNSTLKMRRQQLFMHYFDENTKIDPNNPNWQNQGITFWFANEPFEKKSLPPEFKNYQKKFFIFNDIPNGISLNKATAIPWFDMPGGGDKFFFAKGAGQVPLNQLSENKAISYVEVIQITENNTYVLYDRENYILLIDSETMNFEPSTDKFFYNNTEISLGLAYEKGGVHIIKLID